MTFERCDKMKSDPGAVRANAYDMVINGVEMVVTISVAGRTGSARVTGTSNVSAS